MNILLLLRREGGGKGKNLERQTLKKRRHAQKDVEAHSGASRVKLSEKKKTP